MAESSKLVVGTMIIWVPVLFLTTYAGFIEAYEIAARTQLLGLKYPDRYQVYLIVPSMVPTLFTAYSIINKERNTLRLISKVTLFHKNVAEGKSVAQSNILTKREFESLSSERQIEYCIDLRSGVLEHKANEFLDLLFNQHKNSNSDLDRALAFHSRTLVNNGSVDQKTMFHYSKEACALMEKRGYFDKFYHMVLYDYLMESRYLGYEQALEEINKLQLSFTNPYYLVRVEMIKLETLHRMGRISNIDFTELERKIEGVTAGRTELSKLEMQFAKLKSEIWLDNSDFDLLEPYLKQRLYFRKWTGQSKRSVINDLGRMYRKMGDYDQSLMYLNKNLTSGRVYGLPMSEGIALVNIGKTLAAQGSHEASLNSGRESLAIFSEIDYPRGVIESLTLMISAARELNVEHQEYTERLQALQDKHKIMAQSD